MNLANIRVLWCQPDTLALWGIPYDMRPGQSPHHIRADLRQGWVWLGSPGWWGSRTPQEVVEILAFLVKCGDVPEGPNEWCTIYGCVVTGAWLSWWCRKVQMKNSNIYIVDNTPTPSSAGVSKDFHDVIIVAIHNGGVLPDELSDLVTLTPVVVDGATRWILDWA